MTGHELLAQVREALESLRDAGDRPGMLEEGETALAALDGCVLLTREEAVLVREHVERDEQRMSGIPRCSCLALLTPEEPS